MFGSWALLGMYHFAKDFHKIVKLSDKGVGSSDSAFKNRAMLESDPGDLGVPAYSISK